jgi:hypothetical protein
MSVAKKFGAGLILIGVITAMTLPNRQTVPVLGAVTKLVTGSEHTAITGNL